MKINKKIIVSSVALAIFAANNANAAGYSTNLTSTSALANSYAGSAAGAHDASDMFFNAANIADFEKAQLVGSLSHLDLDIDVDAAAYPGKTGNELQDAGVDVQVPALYFATPINDQLAFGFAFTVPFGLNTKYDASWVARESSLENKVETYNFNPNIAYKINDQLSLGLGLQAQYIKAVFTKDAGSYTLAKTHGTDWGYGYNLGLKYKLSDELEFGLGYRSKIDHKISGNSDVRGSFNSDVDFATTTPESLTAGVTFEASDKLQLAFDTTWTRWSRLKDLKFKHVQVSALDATADFNWNDSFLYSLGANYQSTDNFLLRLGTAFEKDAVPDSARNFVVPTSDRIWASIGFNYKFTDDFSVDATYLHQFHKKVKTDINNAVKARYSTNVNVISIGFKKDF